MQLNLFAEDNRLEKLTELGDSLLKLNVVNWKSFRPVLETVFQKERKSNAGRLSYDVVMMFKIFVLQRLFNISDDQTKFQISDHMSFMRFLGFSLGDRVPDAKTIWLYRENLTKAGVIDHLFIDYCKALERNGIITHTGTIIDATFVDAPRQSNTCEENKTIKSGEVSKELKENTPKPSISWHKRTRMPAVQRRTTKPTMVIRTTQRLMQNEKSSQIMQ